MTNIDAPPKLKETARQRMNEIRPSVLHSDFLACNTYDESAGLGRIKSPTLILCGMEDQMAPMHLSQELHNRIKNSILVKVDDAGHMVMLEAPLKVANPLKLFLDGIHYQPGSTE